MNIKKNYTQGILLVVGMSVALCGFAQGVGMEHSSKKFSLHLGSSRVIYNLNSKGSFLTVNNDHDYPILVQSEVLMEDREKKAPFVVTPPLFRIDALQSSRVRIVRTGGNFPEDRESLQWLCVKALPPKEGDIWAKDWHEKADDKVHIKLQFSVNTCIKLFVRPSTVNGHSEDVAGKIKWQKVGNKLKGTNPTPFYINLSELKIGGNALGHHYIAPFSSFETVLPVNTTGNVQWKVITDYGGVSGQFESELIR